MNVVTLKAAQVKWDINAYASPPHQREWGLSQARTSPPPLRSSRISARSFDREHQEMWVSL